MNELTAATAAQAQSGGPAPTGAGTLLRARNIHKIYPMGKTALSVLTGCDLEVRRGEFVAIMGKSGSGKSTLLHILGALDVPNRGQVTFAGEDVFAPEGQRTLRPRVFDVFSPYERHRNVLRRRQFGFVFQFYHLLPELNVLENVTLPRMVDSSMLGAHADALAILERVGLDERLKHRPNELSGGERQRVAIARALVHKPQILFADEPTGNLDAEAGGNILRILTGLHRDGQTIVMVTHDPSVAAAADRTLHLERGALHKHRPGPPGGQTGAPG